MESDFDLEVFRLPRDRGYLSQVIRPTRRRQSKPGRFIKGPIPMDWIGAAASLPGKTLHVGLAIWFLSGLHKRSVVTPEAWVLDTLGMSQKAWLQGIERLEQAGLVRLRRGRGRRAVVTILDAGTRA